MAHETWSHHLDYAITMLGYSVGVGSLWRFPYLFVRNGGGAFLIPYILFTIVCTIPCVFLEMTIGQFSQKGAVEVWNLSPAFKGVGIGTVLITLFYCTYYPALLAWFLYYLYYSFFPNLPWASCHNDWNTDSCVSSAFSSLKDANTTLPITNSTLSINRSERGLTAAEEFWKFNVLEITDSLENLGEMRWPIVGCLACIYVVVFLFLFQGIKVSGKVVYVTVGLPYILVAVFLVRGCLLPGSADGILFFLSPKFERLLEPKIWIEACSLALFSVGPGFGCLITMASHNKFSNNCFRDTIVIVTIDVITAVYIGLAFFSVMGHVAYIRGVSVDAFQSSGFNLGFIVYPEVILSLPLPQLWSALTFVILLTLGIDCLSPSFELTVTALVDQFPRFGERKWLLHILVLLPAFLIGWVYLTQGGLYVLTLVEWYAFFPSMVLFTFMECVIVCWVYGTRRMEKDILLMWGKSVPRVMYIALKYISPLLFLVIFGFSLYSYRPPKYGDYIYPAWATGIGWIISFASIVPLPVVFVWTVYKSKGSSFKEKVRKSLQPNKHWGPPTEDKTELADQQESMM